MLRARIAGAPVHDHLHSGSERTGVALLFYGLLKPVSKTLSLLAAIFRLIFAVVMTVNALNYFGLSDVFNGGRSPAAFNIGYGIALVPFGIHCLVTSYLIFKSTFLPKIISILIPLAGLSYPTFIWRHSETAHSFLIFWSLASSEKVR
jgi:hypothetical protein